MSIDHGRNAQQAAEKHLQECWDAHDRESEGEDVTWPEDMAGPFCGCETCVIREVLHAAWPHVLAAAKEELQAPTYAEPEYRGRP